MTEQGKTTDKTAALEENGSKLTAQTSKSDSALCDNENINRVQSQIPSKETAATNSVLRPAAHGDNLTKAELKAQRRAKQEAQRQTKAATKVS